MKVSITRFMRFFLIIALVVPFILASPAQDADAKNSKVRFWLTILHNNDGESDLINLGSGREDFGGVARFKTLVDELKAEAVAGRYFYQGARQGVIMVSSGDNFLAGPEFTSSLEKGVPYYDTIALDLIGYDALAIGNHDFDFGPDVLADFIEGYQYTFPPYLSANIDFSDEPRLQALFEKGRIARSVIIRERGERIGIIGAITPNLSFISSPRNAEVLEDVAGAINAEVKALKRRLVNKIIVISHLQSVQEDLALIPLLNDVDVVVAGGGDEVLANPDDLIVPGDTVYGPYPLYANDVDGTQVAVVTTAGSYAYVGQLVVGFDIWGNVIEINTEKSGPVRVAGGTQPDAVESDPYLQALVVEPVSAYVANLASNVIATSEVPLEGRRSPGIRTQETNEGNLVADSLFWQASELAASFGVNAPDVALQNGGGIRNNSLIPAGNITELDTFNILSFSNFVSIVENISREQFKEILENAVSRVEFVDGRFAQVSGFKFTYSASGIPQVLDANYNVTTPGTRVQQVVLNDGTVIVENGNVVPGPALTIATIDFLAKGGDQYPFRNAAFTTLGVSYQRALFNYITDALGGLITAAQYPTAGEGRITRLP